ncbi:hypothetical protein GCM10009727_04950 [Actinomadura napierensis]|uniref:Uncharacterized protein n=1 Tax=Actinomadura napierensis TaxID=267854 RepID=A0ABN2Y2K2_9ACTN
MPGIVGARVPRLRRQHLAQPVLVAPHDLPGRVLGVAQLRGGVDERAAAVAALPVEPLQPVEHRQDPRPGPVMAVQVPLHLRPPADMHLFQDGCDERAPWTRTARRASAWIPRSGQRG